MTTLIITGASKGIGLAVARRFLHDGYRVINIARTPAPDDTIENHRLDLSTGDVEDRLRELLDRIISREKICLVHNASAHLNDTITSCDPNQLQRVMNTNIVVPHILNQMVLPDMLDGSSIIYVGSTLSEKAVPGAYSYVISKHAMVGMMRATCQDLAGREIHTTCVCPGFTDTEMLREHAGNDDETLSAIAAMSTFNRLVEPPEIAETVWFAARNPVINGAVIHANLGQVEH